ncbi:MAG: DUF2029 domain-containing protein [Nocardiopsaceae bacterium]|nr:DUF2029 domain-containing protein [Nocardiopsaceae bacterium]
MSPVLEQRGEEVAVHDRARGRWLLIAGAVAFALVVAGWAAYDLRRASDWTLYPVDFDVYRDGGLILRHISPPYNPKFADPLYGWSRTALLPFTYPPFAAAVFAVVSFVPPVADPRLTELVNVVALVGAAWCTMRALGWTGWRVRLGGALLGAAVGLLTEPVFRTIYLGQINIVLMLMIIWDLTQPDTPSSRRWKGILTGVAAGIKLTPLVFVPYLLLARKFRQAFLMLAGFAGTVAVGFAVVPSGSVDYWFNGLFAKAGRTGFPGWGGNQSLRGLVTRLAGSLAAGTVPWLVLAVVVGVAGLVAAALLSRAGHEMLGLLTAALVGLLDSPISWDHHWVWVMPGMMAAAHYAGVGWRSRRGMAADGPHAVIGWRSRRRMAVGDLALAKSTAPPERTASPEQEGGPAAGAVPGNAVPGAVGGVVRHGWALASGCAALVVAGFLAFAPWPGQLWGAPVLAPGNYTWGLVWAAPDSRVLYYTEYGDKPWYKEYHWHGFQLLAGNAYVLSGLGVFVVLCVVAATVTRRPRPTAA